MEPQQPIGEWNTESIGSYLWIVRADERVRIADRLITEYVHPNVDYDGDVFTIHAFNSTVRYQVGPYDPTTRTHEGTRRGPWSSEAANMSIDAAAELLGVTPTRIYQLLKAGELEKFKVGARSYIQIASLIKYTERLAERSAPRQRAPWRQTRQVDVGAGLAG